MLKKEAKIGTRVTTNMGCRRTGRVVTMMPLSACNDGTYRLPERGEVCVGVKWEDGTQGIANVKHLEVVPKVFCPNCKEEVWDVAFASKLNKCWGCGLAFD
jgi:hypothetical protein